MVYKLHTTTIDCIPFKTDHSPESIGFYFPSLDLVYIGDGRITTSYPLPASYILYDALYENELFPSRSTEESMITLLNAVKTTGICYLHLPHHGTLSLLQRYQINVRLDDSILLHPFIPRMASALGLVCPTASFILVGMDFPYEYIRLSSNWFHIQQKDPSIVQYDDYDSIYRVYYTNHATSEEIKNYKKQFPACHWLPIGSTIL